MEKGEKQKVKKKNQGRNPKLRVSSDFTLDSKKIIREEKVISRELKVIRE